MLKTFRYCLIGCVVAILIGALLLCFDATAFLFPFTVTLMALSGCGVVIFGILWLCARTGYLK